MVRKCFWGSVMWYSIVMRYIGICGVCISLCLTISAYISLYLAISHYIYIYLSIFPYISLYLNISLYVSPYLPISVHISLYLSISLHISLYVFISHHISLCLERGRYKDTSTDIVIKRKTWQDIENVYLPIPPYILYISLYLFISFHISLYLLISHHISLYLERGRYKDI